MFDIGLVVSIQAIYPDNPSLNPAVFNFLMLFYKLLSEKVSGGLVYIRSPTFTNRNINENVLAGCEP